MPVHMLPQEIVSAAATSALIHMGAGQSLESCTQVDRGKLHFKIP